MENKTIRVGIIGVDVNRGWASMAHIPALQSLPQFKITALSSRTKEKATAAGEKFGIEHTFDNDHELVTSQEIDLVVITVKVPYHKELVTAALHAGKKVYCEWPLGNGLEEAVMLDELAREKNIYAVTGLQTQSIPAINYIRDLIGEGYVGEVLSTSMIASGGFAEVDQANAYTMDQKNGASMLSIVLGATVHAVCYCLGEFKELTAVTATQRKNIVIADTGTSIPVTIADQISISGIMENEVIAAIHFRAGASRGTNFLWEINGTEGNLQITADGGHIGFYPVTIKGGKGTDKVMAELPVPEEYNWVNDEAPKGPAFHVAQHYTRVAKDIHEGTKLCSTFEDAVVRHRMINAIETAAASGIKQSYLVF